MTGAELIAKERDRQVASEGYDGAHDDDHVGGELALAAACYASPVPIYVREDAANVVSFVDPWPWTEADARPRRGNVILPRTSQTPHQQVRQLTKAGALIAAEIDRIQRAIARRAESNKASRSEAEK